MSRLGILAIAALALIAPSGAVAGSPPPQIPYVTRDVSPEQHMGTFARLSRIEGRLALYNLSYTECPTPDPCAPTNEIRTFDGVTTKTLFSSDQFVFDIQATPKLVALDTTPTDADPENYPLYTARGGKKPKVLGKRPFDAPYDLSGDDIAWANVDPDNGYRYDIYLNGRNLTKRVKASQFVPEFSSPVALSGKTLAFFGETREDEIVPVVYRTSTKKFRVLPPLLGDQTETPLGFAAGLNGDKVTIMLRDYVDEQDDSPDHSEIRIYDVSSKETTSVPIGAPIGALPTDEGAHFVWYTGSGGSVQYDLDVRTGAVQEITPFLAAEDYVGNVSGGFLSVGTNDGEMGLLDLESHDTFPVVDDGGSDVLWSSGRNVDWFVGGSPETLRVAYPADEATLAMTDSVRKSKLSKAQRKPLLNALDSAVGDIRAGEFASASQDLEAFMGAVENQRSHLGNKLADELLDAASAVSGVFSI